MFDFLEGRWCYYLGAKLELVAHTSFLDVQDNSKGVDNHTREVLHREQEQVLMINNIINKVYQLDNKLNNRELDIEEGSVGFVAKLFYEQYWD